MAMLLVSSLYWIHCRIALAPVLKTILFTQKNDDVGAVSVTKRNCTAKILKVVSLALNGKVQLFVPLFLVVWAIVHERQEFIFYVDIFAPHQRIFRQSFRQSFYIIKRPWAYHSYDFKLFNSFFGLCSAQFLFFRVFKIVS